MDTAKGDITMEFKEKVTIIEKDKPIIQEKTH